MIIPDRDSEGHQVTKIDGVKEPNGLRARIKGSHAHTVPYGTTADIDWLIPQLAYLGTNKKAYFDGVQYYAKDAEVFDKVSFQVVDVDNILGYGAGFIVEEFAEENYVMPNCGVKMILYKSKLVPGLYVRIKYESTGATDVKFVCNILRHLAENEDA